MKNKGKDLDAVYLVWDTELKQMWHNGTNKIAWVSSGAAKNAWNLCHATWKDKKYFDSQNRYVIIIMNNNAIEWMVDNQDALNRLITGE